MIRTSEACDALYAALAAASSKLTDPAAARTAEVRSSKGTFSYSYATLGDALPMVRAVLSEQGCFHVQHIDRDRATVVTRVCHASGQWLETEYPVVIGGASQAQGGNVTYARRYALFALLGLAPVDDDENASQQGQQERDTHRRQSAPRRQQRPQQQRQPDVNKRRRWLAALMKDAGLDYGVVSAYVKAERNANNGPAHWGERPTGNLLRALGFEQADGRWVLTERDAQLVSVIREWDRSTRGAPDPDSEAGADVERSDAADPGDTPNDPPGWASDGDMH